MALISGLLLYPGLLYPGSAVCCSIVQCTGIHKMALISGLLLYPGLLYPGSTVIGACMDRITALNSKFLNYLTLLKPLAPPCKWFGVLFTVRL